MSVPPEVVAQLDEIAARYGGDRVGSDGKLDDRMWNFVTGRRCTLFVREAESLGFQMWASSDLAGLLLPGDAWWTEGEYRSCIDGTPVVRRTP